MKNKGFTLIELMVVLVMVGITVEAGYSFYMNTFKFQALQEKQKDMQIRLQLAMDLLVSDVRSVGFGVIDPRDSGQTKVSVLCTGVFDGIKSDICLALTPGNATTTSDTITLAERTRFVGTLEAETKPVPALRNKITISPPGAATSTSLVLAERDLITIGGFFSSRVAAVDGHEITVNPPLDLTKDKYPKGMDVYAVEKVVYKIDKSNIEGDTETALFRTVGGASTLIASGIEDLQITYSLSGRQPSGAVAPGNFVNDPLGQAFLALKVSLIARMKDPDPNFQGGLRPALEDHLGAEAGDNFRRMVLTRIVELVNDGCEPKHLVC